MNWIVGDIHGQIGALESLISHVWEVDGEPVFHFVGDYVDRGKHSKCVVDYILAMDNARCIRGNHDDIFDLICNKKSETSAGTPNEDAQQAIWFMRFGMVETLNSYGVPADLMIELVDTYDKSICSGMALSQGSMFSDAADDIDDELVEIVMDHIRKYIPQSHKDFFRNLPLINSQDDFFVGHAFLSLDARSDCLEALAEERPNEILWGRFESHHFEQTPKWGKVGYFGHTPTKTYGGKSIPIIRESLVLVDTGAVYGSKLTAFCHETGKYMQVGGSARRPKKKVLT